MSWHGSQSSSGVRLKNVPQGSQGAVHYLHFYSSLFCVAPEKDRPVKGPRKQAWIQSWSISEQEGPALF